MSHKWYNYDYYYSWYSYWWRSWGWWQDIKSWASQYTYVRPNYQKIKDELLQKQKKLNAMWYAIKIWYGEASVSRKPHWFTRVSAKDWTQFDEIRKFLDKTKSLWVKELWSVDTFILQSMLSKKAAWWWKDTWAASNDWSILDSIEKYNDVRQSFVHPNSSKEDKLKKDWGTSWWWSSSFELAQLDISRVNKIADQLKNKLKIKEITYTKEDSLRKWNRISRKYTMWMSHKPLNIKITHVNKKKKCLCILDCSGSMSSVDHSGASHFMEAIWNTSIFDADIYYSNEMCIHKSNWTDRLRLWWWEWFAILDQRLSVINIDTKSYDYIFVFTDMEIWLSEMSNLWDILKCKKHILFNFSEIYWEEWKPQFPDMKIQYVSKVQDMIDNLVNYV